MRQTSLLGKTSKFVLVSVAAGSMLACGGGGDPILVASADVPVVVSPATASTAKAVISSIAQAATPIVFNQAVPALGTASTTTFTLSATTAASAAADIGNFAVADRSGNSYSGAVEPGSCILVIKVSSFGAFPAHPYGVGARIPLSPCSFTAKVAGVSANGTSITRTIEVVLGSATTTLPLPVTVAANGQVSFGSTVITTLPVVAASGA